MRALSSMVITQTPCLSSWACAPQTKLRRMLIATPTTRISSGRAGQLWPASTFGSTAGRRNNAERRRTVVVKAASTSTLLFLSALPFVIVGFVWVGVSLLIGRIEYDYYQELRELEEIEAERQRLEEQGLATEEPAITGEASEPPATEGNAEPEPVGAGRRNRPIREE
eukprot:TRINITY_DN3553_c0_g2_i1.p1 TRINITY_DN3553_c0_g2~~TRINITY_DN3553_c0_g2_i1.p1  ORF type:complete len:168 (+),score=15.98 TRINITY_DN3553_c0_g2_i1:125-628(+)